MLQSQRTSLRAALQNKEVEIKSLEADCEALHNLEDRNLELRKELARVKGFPSIDEVKAVIPKEGMTHVDLLKEFEFRCDGAEKRKAFQELVNRAGFNYDQATSLYIPQRVKKNKNKTAGGKGKGGGAEKPGKMA